MPLWLWLVLGVLAAQAGPAAAEELVLGVEARTIWDDNVFFVPRDEEDDVSLRAGPDLALRRQRGDLQYELGYRPVYETFVDLDGIGAFDHLARLEASWRPRETTRVVLRDDFGRVRTLSRRLEATDPASAPDAAFAPDVEVVRSRVVRNGLELTLSHDLSPRWQASGRLGSQLFEFSDAERFDSHALDLEAAFGYALSPRDRVGLGLGAIRQDFDDTPLQDGSTTHYYRFFARWLHDLDPTWSLSLAAGPTWVDAESGAPPAQLAGQPEFPFVEVGDDVFVRNVTTCPTLADGTPFLGAGGSCGFQGPLSPADAAAVRDARTDLALVGAPPSDPDLALTFFGEGTMTKRWTDLTASLTYRRTASTVSGSNASTDLDALVGRLVWTPSRRWSASLVGSWDRRRSSTDQSLTVVTLEPTALSGVADVARAVALRSVEFDDALDVSQLRFEARLLRRLTRRTSLFGIASWQRQRSEGDLIDGTRRVERLRVILGVRWEMEPIHL